MSDAVKEEISRPNTGEMLVESVQINYKDGNHVVVPVRDSGILFGAVHISKTVHSDWGDSATHHAISMRWVTDDTGDEHQEALDSE